MVVVYLSSPALIVSRKADQLKVEQALFNDYNDRIWLPWNNGGNNFKIHAGFFKNFRLSYERQIYTIGKTDDTTNPPRGGDSGRFFRMQIVTVG